MKITWERSSCVWRQEERVAERLRADRFNRTGTKRAPGEPTLPQGTAFSQHNKGTGQGKQQNKGLP